MSVHRLRFRLCHLGWGALLIWAAASSIRAQEDDAEFRPGLLVEYRTPQASLQRIDPQIAFNWKDRSPDPMLPAEPFTATWTGQLLIREDVTFRFHAHATGKVRVTVGESKVLESAADARGWISGPETKLEFGLQPLTVTYEQSSPHGQLHLYWSSDRFPLEPLPESQLFLPDDEASATAVQAIELRERGRQLFTAYRCAACHRDAAVQPPEPAPALAHVSSGTSSDWLIAKLQHRHAEASTSKMPAFGFGETEARSILTWLTSQARPAELLTTPHVEPDKKNPIPDGNVLLHSLGCLACHRVGELGSNTTFGGGDLSHVGARRSRDWLHTQLREPSKLNPHARMPVFELSDGEREQLVETLSKLGNVAADPPVEPVTDAALIESGKNLFAAAQCAACHESPEQSKFTPRAPKLERPITDWERTCLSSQADPAHRRPSYPQADRAALQAYVTALVGQGGALSSPGNVDRGLLVLEQRNCLGCHERGSERGIVPTAGQVVAEVTELTGQSQALIPPNLTAVGDKLFDEPLTKSVRGEQQRRMPWLRVRMPKFAHSEADQAALVARFIGADRIPVNAPETPVIPLAADSQELIAGRTLTGPHGFSCIACHECGKYVPPNVAIATHGSDLLGFRQRMRPEFFFRWTRSPLRVVPGIEMPSYERPVPGILDGDPNTQLIALWHALGDPDFSVPTNPTAVEQLLTVRPGERTIVMRDVFSVSDVCGGGYVPRALAMGFDNGQSILFDLDRARVREWTLGEFARQRTQGKSWYWDMAGAPILKDKHSGDGLWLKLPDHNPRVIAPSSTDGRPITLTNYAQTDNVVVVDYIVRFDTNSGPVRVEVHETWQTYAGSEGESIQRTISANGTGQGQLLVAVPDEKATGVSRVLARDPGARTARGAILKGKQSAIHLADGTETYALTREAAGGDPSLTLHYTTRLQSPPGATIEIADPVATSDPVTTAPGFRGTRLPIATSIMPTAMAWRPDGTLVFTSLKGHVYLAKDTDGDGVEDTLSVFEEGLAAPFGMLADGDDLLVAHKPELLRLRDTDGDGRCDERTVVADGWGYTHDYHDWTAGPVRDADGNMFLAISSDYQQLKRDRSTIQWRGKVLQLDPTGTITPIAHELRFPMGIALDAQGRLFVSDQQGVQNCFNEINHIVKDGRYGVPALADPPGSEDHTRASVQIPHPWTRSVNGIVFLPPSSPRTAVRGLHETPLDVFAGHGLGCEYNGRFLVRFTMQEVKGALQGAVYEFTSPKWDKDSDAFLGPICTAVSPDGSLYVGSIFDSGWLGGRNTGEIVKLTPTGEVPNGIREVRAIPGGFEIDFIHPVDPSLAADPANYTLSGYTRVWQGSYATPDSDLHTPTITTAKVSDDARSVTLHVDDLRAQHVYELNCRPLTMVGAALRPSSAHYSMNRVP
jgi:mono/diheme cytochrome c family protein/glucose/arabinose dehydrogenase